MSDLRLIRRASLEFQTLSGVEQATRLDAGDPMAEFVLGWTIDPRDPWAKSDAATMLRHRGFDPFEVETVVEL